MQIIFNKPEFIEEITIYTLLCSSPLITNVVDAPYLTGEETKAQR